MNNKKDDTIRIDRGKDRYAAVPDTHLSVKVGIDQQKLNYVDGDRNIIVNLKDRFDIERELISRLTGLMNKTAGGQGSSGRQLSEETRKKLGNGMRGRKHSEETKAKMRLKRKGRSN